MIPSTQYIPPPMHHYSLHSLDLSTLIHDLALLVYHIVVADAVAENVLEISVEGGTAVVVQQSQVVLLFLPSLIENPCNSWTHVAAGKKHSAEMNKLSYDAVHNPAVVNIDLYVVPCYIEVLHSVGDNANADFDDPAAVDDVVFDTTDRTLILLRHPSFRRLPGPVLEQFGVSGPLLTTHHPAVPDSSRFLDPEDSYFDSY